MINLSRGFGTAAELGPLLELDAPDFLSASVRMAFLVSSHFAVIDSSAGDNAFAELYASLASLYFTEENSASPFRVKPFDQLRSSSMHLLASARASRSLLSFRLAADRFE